MFGSLQILLLGHVIFSRSFLIGEQPNPWGLTLFSYITISADYTFTRQIYNLVGVLAV